MPALNAAPPDPTDDDTDDTPEYPPGIIECTAWDCVGKYSDLPDNTHAIRVKGGRTIYAMAFPTNDYTGVRLARFDTSGEYLRQINRYIDPLAAVELIPLPERVKP